MNLEQLEQSHISALDKALPYTNGLKIAEVADQHWNILTDDLPMPLVVLKHQAILNNLRWMQKFTKMAGVEIAPHGKATMSPQLYQIHLDHGAWGISVANVQQLRVCLQFGMKRIFLANQLIDISAIRFVLEALKRDLEVEFYCLVDSMRGLDLLLSEAKRADIGRPVQVLLEIGLAGRRTGVRESTDALLLAKAIHQAYPYIALCGIEGYEGSLVSGDPKVEEEKVTHYLQKIISVMEHCQQQQWFSTETLLLSAGGSAFFDLVAREWIAHHFSYPVKMILRSAAYLAHDSGFYKRLFESIKRRHSESAWPEGELQPALEVWSTIQSRPESNLAILNMGKRDASFDIDLPIPQAWFRLGTHKEPQPLVGDYKIFKMDDQHAYLRIDPDSPLQVGDRIVCGISHPCTTFDKWAHIPLVDDGYEVKTMIKTYF